MRNTKDKIIHSINLTLIIATALMISLLFSYRDHTLYENGKWDSGKTHAEKGLLAAWTTMLSKSVVSHDRLNIAGWHGYQEFIFKRAVKFEAISFRSRALGHSFSFILNKTDSGSTGICFNYKKDSSFFFKSDHSGRFLEIRDFSTDHLWKNKDWDEIECKMSSGTLHLSINDHSCFEYPIGLLDSVHMGFRGGKDDVYIDDIAMVSSGQNVLLEDFNSPFKFKWQSLVFFALALIFYFIMHRRYALNLILLNLVAFLAICFYYFLYFWVLSGWYPSSVGYKDWKGVNSRLESGDAVRDRITHEFPVGDIAGRKPVIVFVGSSQTWGAGASSAALTYPAQVQQDLREHFGDSSITAINVGVQGTTSDQLLAYYDSSYIRYRPLLTIIDLSTNDYDTAVFRRSIRRFISLNNNHRIKTLLVLEPNDTVSIHSLRNHDIMRSEALRGGVPYVDIQLYTDSLARSGFLWWDYVHMTDYGYRVFADRLTPAVIQVLQEDSTIYHSHRF